MFYVETKLKDKWFKVLDLKESGKGPRTKYRQFDTEEEASFFAREFLDLDTENFRIVGAEDDILNDTTTE